MQGDEALRRWNDRMLADVNQPISHGALKAGSLLRPGATAEDLAGLERRLGVPLPASYRSFLSVSNGAFGDWKAVPASEPRRRAEDEGIGLQPTGGVVPLIEAVPDVVIAWTEVIGSPEELAEDVRLNGVVVNDVSALGEALLISSLTWEEGKYFLCLAPTSTPEGDGVERYELWDKGYSEITRYLSFGDWLEHSVSGRWYDLGPVWRAANASFGPEALRASETWPPPLRVGQVRRLAAAPWSSDLIETLEPIRTESYPYIRLAAAQVAALVGHTTEHLVELAEGEEPTIALAAQATLRILLARAVEEG